MKTFMDYDEQLGKYKPKLSTLYAVLVDKDNRPNIGTCSVDLADFVEIKTHNKELILQSVMEGASPASHICLMVETSSGAETSRDTQMQARPGRPITGG